jgi:hypothetical protein
VEEQASLKCWYDHNSNPAWTIDPLKKELLSESPRIVQVYEILGNKLISNILQNTKNRFRHSYVVSPKITAQPDIRTRSSANTFLKDGSVPELDRIVEPVQVVNYIFGRHYVPHPDAMRVSL